MASDNCSQERYQNWHKYISSGNKTNEDYKELYNNWAKKVKLIFLIISMYISVISKKHPVKDKFNRKRVMIALKRY